jgi:spore maturation protein CgeB
MAFVRHVPPPKHSAFYSSSRLTLSVTRAAMAQSGYCPSGRLFEAAACGTPVVSDRWEGLEKFFEPDCEIFLASGSNDVLNLLACDRTELGKVGENARSRVLGEHTSDRRAAQLVEYLEAAA